MAVDVTVKVDYGEGCGSARFVGQALVEPIDTPSMSLAGDSGAAFVDERRRAVELINRLDPIDTSGLSQRITARQRLPA